MTTELTTFSYTEIEPDTAEHLKRTATAIRQSVASQVEGVVAVGKSLVEVKGSLPHGMFGPWLAHEFSWTERTAVNYMHVAETFGSNPKRVSDLPLRIVYRLAAPSLPPDARQKVLVALDDGVKDERTIGAMISHETLEAKRAVREAKQSPELKAKEKAREKARLARRNQEYVDLQRKTAEREAAEREAAYRFWKGLLDESPQFVDAVLKALRLPYYVLVDELKRLRALEGEMGAADGVETAGV